jgi:hypothetical protein
MSKLDTARLIAFLKYLNADSSEQIFAKDIKARVDGTVVTAILDGQHRETWIVLHSSEFSEYELREEDNASFYFVAGETFAVYYSENQDYFENLN